MKRKTWLLVWACILAGCGAAPPRPTPLLDNHPDLHAQVDRIALAAVRDVPLDALSVVVLRGDEVLLAHGYGGAGVTADSVYRIGSISKLVTALGIGLWVERGAVRLDDPLDTFFPGRLPAPPVTIRQLLNHTSGLASHERAAVERWRTRRLPITDTFVWQHLATEPRAAAPGAAWNYSSGNFHLLGSLIEQLAGVPYSTFVRQEIAVPLNLPSLRNCSGESPVSGQAPDYVVIQGQLEADLTWDLPGIGAAGGLCASARDIARLLHAVANGSLVSTKTLARMTSPTPVGQGASAGYGLGVRLGDTDGALKWGHTGGGAVGNRAVVAHYPASDLTIVVLTNTERADTPASPMDIELAVARLALESPGPRETGDPRADLSIYAGTYVGQGRTVKIERGPKGLQQQVVGAEAPSIPLRYLGGHAFLPYPEYPEFRIVFQLHQGASVALSQTDSGWFAGMRLRQVDGK